MSVEHEWNGDDISRELERATREGLERVGAKFVRAAHPRTPVWQGFLRRSTRFDPVSDEGGELSIEMGSFDINYAEYQERGTSRMQGHFMYQTSADETWPTLGDEIKDSIRGGKA